MAFKRPWVRIPYAPLKSGILFDGINIEGDHKHMTDCEFVCVYLPDILIFLLRKLSDSDVSETTIL